MCLIEGLDANDVKGLMCWGFRESYCLYNGLSYAIRGLLEDQTRGVVWYSEPHLRVSLIVGGQTLQVSAAFRHSKCARFCTNGKGLLNFTCSMCAQIPQENDFKKKVLREDHAIDKRDTRTTSGGRRVGYLTLGELFRHGRDMRKKLRLEKLNHWSARARIVQLKVKRPTLKEMAKESSSKQNLLKFCNNILNAHRSGAFGGRHVLWDFMKDVAQNLNRDSRRNR